MSRDVQTYPFFSFNNRGQCEAINLRRLGRYLNDLGFGMYQTIDGRTVEKTLFRNVDNVLQIHNYSTIKSIIVSIVENDNELDFHEIDMVSDKVLRLTVQNLASACEVLDSYSIEGYVGTKQLKVMLDDAKTCYLPFKNGVVVITKDDIQLRDYAVLEDNCIWESSILDHEIDLDSTDGLDTFRHFVHFALKQDVIPVDGKDLFERYNEGCDEDHQSRKKAFETSYGYLIHNYNSPDETPMVVYADAESDHERAEGRNGKSLSMKTVEYFKKTTFIDGKAFRKSLNDSSRFNFSSVTIDTKLVVINDLNPDLDLTQLFSQITDDFTIEGKGTNKIVIPRDKKPKMACNTNYVLSGSGASYQARQHIVEFGNYWNKVEKMKMKPKDILGGLVGVGFNKADWNKFFRYGFECTQLYLNEGLVRASNNRYDRKNLIQSVEGERGSGEVVDWLETWCTTTRIENNYHKDGLSEKDLFKQYELDRGVPEIALQTIDQKQFQSFMNMVWSYVSFVEGYEYNAHKAAKGTTRTQRRWRNGERGNQENWVLITHKDD